MSNQPTDIFSHIQKVQETRSNAIVSYADIVYSDLCDVDRGLADFWKKLPIDKQSLAISVVLKHKERATTHPSANYVELLNRLVTKIIHVGAMSSIIAHGPSKEASFTMLGKYPYGQYVGVLATPNIPSDSLTVSIMSRVGEYINEETPSPAAIWILKKQPGIASDISIDWVNALKPLNAPQNGTAYATIHNILGCYSPNVGTKFPYIHLFDNYRGKIFVHIDDSLKGAATGPNKFMEWSSCMPRAEWTNNFEESDTVLSNTSLKLDVFKTYQGTADKQRKVIMKVTNIRLDRLNSYVMANGVNAEKPDSIRFYTANDWTTGDVIVTNFIIEGKDKYRFRSHKDIMASRAMFAFQRFVFAILHSSPERREQCKEKLKKCLELDLTLAYKVDIVKYGNVVYNDWKDIKEETIKIIDSDWIDESAAASSGSPKDVPAASTSDQTMFDTFN